jgi:hypothetical protein
LPERDLLGISGTTAVLAVVLWPVTARADAILHPIVVVWPAAWALLVPIVLIEAAIAVRVIGIRFTQGLWLSFLANLLSTAIGVPIGTCANPFPLMFIAHAEGDHPASALSFFASLLVPLYLVSVITEAWVARSYLVDSVQQQKAWRWAWLANLATYGLISAGLLAILLISWLKQGSR